MKVARRGILKVQIVAGFRPWVLVGKLFWMSSLSGSGPLARSLSGRESIGKSDFYFQ